MKIAIIGSRKFNNYKLLKDFMEAFIDKYIPDMPHIVSGGAKGADRLAHNFAKNKGYPITIFYPNYDLHGRSAPLKRNYKIIEHSDVVIAFWDGESKGTYHSIKAAKSANKEIVVYNYKTEEISRDDF